MPFPSAAAAAALRSVSPCASPPCGSAAHVLFKNKLNLLVGFQAQQVICAPVLIRSVVKSLSSDITNGGDGTSEPTRELLERLFAKTQSLHPIASEDNELSMNIEALKSEFEAALSILKKKERDLQHAEKRVSVDRRRLNQTKQDLDQRAEEIRTAYARQQEMEKALRKAGSDLALQVRQINNMKLLVEEQDKKIASSQGSLSQKVTELEKLKQDMLKKNEEAAVMCSEIKAKEQLLLAANQTLAQQEVIIKELRCEIERKEIEIAESNQLMKANEEKLKIAEQELEKQTSGWLAAQQELKEVAKMASKDMDDIKDTLTGFKRVRSLLDAVRSELIASKEAFTSSRRQVEDQAVQLQKQVQELTNQRLLLMSYTENLEAAQLEIQGKAKELSAMQACCSELESQLLKEREKVKSLEADLTKERESLEQKTKEVDLLQKELSQKENEYCNSQKLVKIKESELLEARHEVHDMKSKVDSIQLLVLEKDSELMSMQSRLSEVNNEVAELQQLLNSKEDQLVEVRAELHDKEQYIDIVQNELDKMGFKCSQAESVVQKIAELTSNLTISIEGEESDLYALLNDEILSTGTALESNLHKHNQLEADIETLKESLQQKDMDLRVSREALAAKDKELKAGLRRWDVGEKELDKLEDSLKEPGDIKALSSLGEETTGDNTVDDMVLRKLQIEAAEVEALAAATALKRLAEMTQEFLRSSKTTVVSGTDLLSSRSANIGEDASKMELKKKMDVILEAEKDIVGLFYLTEQLIRDAGISNAEES